MSHEQSAMSYEVSHVHGNLLSLMVKSRGSNRRSYFLQKAMLYLLLLMISGINDN